MKAQDYNRYSYCIMPFTVIGMFLYIIIGLPVAGILIGWVIARDVIMGKQ